jgi:hypothetical protein
MTTYQPYTYRIAWTGPGLSYYGVRYAVGCNPQDFWKSYYTSSKVVCQLRDELGDPDVIEIRKVFDNSEQAIEWESKVLRRLRVRTNESWINHHANEAPRWDDKHREAHLDGVRGRKYSDRGKALLAEARKRQWADPDFKKIRAQQVSDGMTDEAKAKIAEYQRGQARSDKCKDNSRAMRLAEWADEDKAAARKKAISDAIKAKWADPEYRAMMMARRKKKKS